MTPRLMRLTHCLLAFILGLSIGAQALPVRGEQQAAAQLPASSQQARGLLQAVHTLLDKAPVVKGKFEQLKTVQGFKRPLRSTGVFVVARSKGIAWQVQQPFASTLIVTPDSLQSRDADGALSTQMNASDEPALRTVNAMLFAVMSADVEQLQAMFEVSGQTQGQEWTLHFTPKDALLAGWLGSIDVQGQAFVRRVVLQEVRGDRSEIRLLDAAGSAELSSADAALFAVK